MDVDFPFPLQRRRVAVLGTGLIGGSLALALRGQVAALYLVDPDPNIRALARSWNLGDMVTPDPAEALRHADVILLAAPVRAIVDLIHRLPQWVPHPAVVMDVGSTKQTIVQALATLPPRFDPIGGHPIAGKTHKGLAHADPSLFQGRPFVFTPLERTGPRARAFAQTLSQLLGALPLWMDPQTHDRLLAYTSHLPYLLSTVLALAVPGESREVMGPGFASTVRLASSSPGIMLDILLTNREAILEALDAAYEALFQLRRALEQEQEAFIRTLLEHAQQRYRRWFTQE